MTYQSVKDSPHPLKVALTQETWWSSLLIYCGGQQIGKRAHRAHEILQRAVARWNKDKISFPLLCLIGSLEGEKAYSPKEPNDLPPTGKLATAVTAAISSHNNRIQTNNGIKERNFVRLFGPLGIRTTDITQVLLVELSTLGTRRGDIAHKTLALRTISVTDPFNEATKIKTVLNELQQFDARVTRLLSSLR